MPKRISDNQKIEIFNNFLTGSSLKDLSNSYNFSIQTITKQLKKFLNDDEFKELKIKNNKKNALKNKNDKSNSELIHKNNSDKTKAEGKFSKNINSYEDISDFYEIAPLDIETNFDEQSEISTKPLSEWQFPSVVYLIVDKNIELEFKLLKDYSEWSFLPNDDQNRKTLKIYDEQKIAKQSCKKDERPIKVPNPKIFLIVSNILKSRGISRIIFKDSIFSL